MRTLIFFSYFSSEADLSLFTFSSEATPSPQLVSLLFHSEKVEGKRGRGACKKKKGAKNGPALSFDPPVWVGQSTFPLFTFSSEATPLPSTSLSSFSF